MPAKTRSSRQPRRTTRSARVRPSQSRARVVRRRSSPQLKRRSRSSAAAATRPRQNNSRTSRSSTKSSQRSHNRSIGWVRAIVFWLLLVVVVLFLALKTVLPALTESAWLFGDAAKQEQLIALAQPTSMHIVLLYKAPGLSETSVWLINASEIERWTWLQQPFAMDVADERVDEERVSTEDVWNLISSDPVTARRLIAQNTGLPISDLVVLAETSDTLDRQERALNLTELRAQLRSRTLDRASDPSQSGNSMNALRLWLLAQLAETIKTESIETIRVELQRLRITIAAASLQECQIAVLNGTTIPGLSARFSRGLEQQGFTVVRVGQASETISRTELVVAPDKDEVCAATTNIVRRFLPEERQASLESSLPAQYRAPIVLLLGEDLGSQGQEGEQNR